jgi:superfamily II DNA/RNA helicase
MKFDEIGLNEQVLEAISFMGFEKASPIQEQAIPEILNNRDILAFAQTGTGKTAAFVLPILHKLAEQPNNGINTIIIVPTRELAIQIEQQIQGFSYFIPVTSIAVYGGGDGKDWSTESKALQKDTEIVVTTPGKMISHLNLGQINLKNLKHLVLDEADRMLDMGFYDDIMRIVSYMPKEGRQTLMFSATMPPKIKKLAQTILNNPFEIAIELSKPAEGVTQLAYLAYEEQKKRLINHLISKRPDFKSILVFTSTKAKISQIVSTIKSKGYVVAGISSDLDQKQREEVLSDFRSRKTRILVATDVLSRGIDIKDINLIINYDVPNDAEDYVHRVGRTARAETTGEAITLISDTDMYKFVRIERLIGRSIEKQALPEGMGDGPEWKESSRTPDPRRQFNPRNNKPNGPRPQGPGSNQGPRNRNNNNNRRPNTPHTQNK